MNRREFLGQASMLACALGTPPAPQSYSRELPDMLLGYLAKRLNALAATWDAKRAALGSPADIQARNSAVRGAVRGMIHGLPERTPLNAQVTRVQEHAGYRVENLMFESRPAFWVTGNLYVPAGNGPFPAIISPCGHYQRARMEPEYQAVYLNLVGSGFVVLAYDPIGQGERRYYSTPERNDPELADPVYEHSMPGQLLLLMGQDLTHYRIWDGMRAIDYLLTRPEVAQDKIGCAGHSGGGTLTMFISALDERVRCAVINEGGTGHRWPVHIASGDRVGPSDVEQNLFPAAVHGVDLCDLHVAIAPRPLLALIENYSPGFNRAAEHIRERYKQLGAPDRFATGEATDPHAYTPKLRLATADWFSRWFYGRPGPKMEPDFDIQPPKALYCTRGGSLREDGRGETIFSLIRQRGEQLPPSHPAPGSMAEKIRALLRLEPASGSLAARHLVTTQRKGYAVEKLEFLSEPGIYIPAWVFVPERKTSGRAILFASEAGIEADGMEFGILEQLARRGRTVVAVDVRGVGQTAPPHCQDLDGSRFAHLFSVETAAAYMAWYMDSSLLGMRVRDVLRAVEYALGRPDANPPGVEVIGKGAGALWALYAAALDKRIAAVVAERGLITYASLTRADRYLHTAGIFVRDVLTAFDLPDVAAAIADRPLALLSPVGPMKEADVAGAREAYRYAQQVYARAGAANRFTIAEAADSEKAADQYITLLRS